MTATTSETTATRLAPGFALFLLIAGGLTVVRLAGLHFSVVDLYVDEAQYWSWSRELAFGYFSKPPLIAWAIAATDAVCGSGEACVRSAAPLFYLGTSIVTYAIGRVVYDRTVAFWAGLLLMAAPAIIFSTRIISTDVPLLFFWALALLAFVKLRAGGDTRWAVLLAAAFGLGLLSKYAMAYFVAGILVAALLDPRSAALLRRPALWLALLGGLLLLLPNLLWNLDNGLVTIRHVGTNAGAHFTLAPLKALIFVATQFAIPGPIVFAVLLILIACLFSAALRAEDRMLVAFALPPLAIVLGVALLGKTNANWAATAFISTFVVVAAVLVRRQAWRWLIASLVIGGVVQGTLLRTDTIADQLNFPRPIGDVYRRTMGGAALGRAVADLAAASATPTVVAESRADVAALLYYLRDTDRAVHVWPSGGPRPGNHFELTRPLTDAAAEPILAVSPCPDAGRFGEDFASVEPVGSFKVTTGPTTSKTFHAFRLSAALTPPKAPGPCR